MDEVKVFAPASVSNIGCGFDVMGFAMQAPGDEVIIRKSDRPGINITKITGDEGKLPYDANLNTAGKPVLELARHFGYTRGLEIEIHKKMPLGSGLGSSAASAVAAAFAMNEILDAPLSKLDLLPFAIKGEKIASGAVHADNVAPCLFGGFILIRGYDPMDIVEIPIPDSLYCTVIHPRIEINTKESRLLLPKEIPLKTAIAQWGNTAGLIAGLMKGDTALIGRSIKDAVAEPVRGAFIPKYYEIKASAINAGAIGCSISGSGPSIFAISDCLAAAQDAGDAMINASGLAEGDYDLFISKMNSPGAHVI